MSQIVSKIKRKIWGILVGRLKSSFLYPFLYKSYWHFIIYGNQSNGSITNKYYTAKPNLGAGFGHQMANWIAGVWFAKKFELKYAYSPFTNLKWDQFLGFGEGETTLAELKNKGFKIRKLPLFDEDKSKDLVLQKDIINSYKDTEVVFVAEQDQFYRAQHHVLSHLQQKFFSSKSRAQEKLIYKSTNFNIAIHVRRGDIVQQSGNDNPNLTMRWLDNSYFETVLKQVIQQLAVDKEVHIYLFSQGKQEDYKEFEQFSNLHYCLDMGAMDSFLHMVYADLLITSKSSFSYKPALLNKGIKVCPENFWHGYPVNENWWMVDDKGNLKLKIK